MPPKRGPGFSSQEVQALLDTIERILPVGGIQWHAVLLEHERQFPELRRTKDALKRKFAALYNTKMPTGDPNIPPDVLQAKRLYEEIKKNAEVCIGGGDDDEAEELVEYPDDDDEYITGDEGDDQVEGEEQMDDEDVGVPRFIHHVEETNDEEDEGEA